MKYEKELNNWKAKDTQDKMLIRNFKKVNKNNIEDFFSKKIIFETGMLEGQLGVGPNRINEFTIAATTEAIAIWLLNNVANVKSKGIVIAHDSKINNILYSKIAAKVFNRNNIKVYFFQHNNPQSSPLVSFAVKKLKAAAGINITSLARFKGYSKYKTFNSEGYQLSDINSKKINKILNSLNFINIEYGSLAPKYIGNHIINDYIEEILLLRIRPNDQKQLKVVFSPLNGTGTIIGPKLLQKMDISYSTVKKEMHSIPKISNIKSVNSKNSKAYTKSLRLAKFKKSNLVIIVDQDVDRIGVIYKDNVGKWIRLTGNEIAAIIFSHILKNKSNLKGFIVQNIICSSLIKNMATRQGMKVIETQIGFEKISKQFVKKINNVEMGWEEANSFLFNANASLDKDAFQAMVFIIEATNYLKTQNLDLKSELDHLSKKHGVYNGYSIEKIIPEEIFEAVFNKLSKTKKIHNQKIININDCDVDSKIKLSTLKVTLVSGSWFVLRKLNTDSKVRVYFEGIADNKKDAKEITKHMIIYINKVVARTKKLLKK